MTEIALNLYIGTTGEIPTALTRGFQVVNLARTYHYDLHEWSLKGREDKSAEKCYIVCEEKPNIVSLNWVDAHEAKYFDYEGKGVSNLHKVFDFIEKRTSRLPVMIVCNKGMSRSPSVTMAYLAKRTNRLSMRILQASDAMEGKSPDEVPLVFEKPNYEQARERFTRLYPNYLPGHGITTFLIENWDNL